MNPTFAFRLVLTLFFTVLLAHFSWGQSKTTFSGRVTDGETGEPMIGASVFIKETNQGTTTNNYGFFSFTAPRGAYTLVVRYVGFDNEELPVSENGISNIRIELSPASIQTDEVVIEGKSSTQNTESTQLGKVTLQMESIKKIPAFMGEVDLIKTLQLLPGVMTAGEGNSGLYVRGGGPDQNLILVDDAQVYNAAHLFGFFSIFNGDAVKNVELIKGGMPANYGGRLASVLNVTLKEGNSKEFEVDGGIGLISSRLTIQGPIKKDTASFIISARRTYIDVLAEPFIKDSSPAKGSGYYFYDLNGKFNYKLNKNNQFFLSGYYGKDVFDFKNKESNFDFSIPWGNATASAKWNHIFNDNLFLSTTASYSFYSFKFASTFENNQAQFFSGIEDYTLKSEANWYPNNLHKVKFGAEATRHKFTPTSATAQQGDTEFNPTPETIFGNAYVLDEYDITDGIRINAGLRYSIFHQVGPYTRFQKDRGTSTTIQYDKGDRIAAYNGIEPRLSARFKTSKSASIKAGYSRNYQYLQLASPSPLSLPTDVWIPVSDQIKPQIGNQYNVGYFHNFKDNYWETSVEVYYKDMKNLVEFANAEDPTTSIQNNIDNQLVQGTGYSYGIEFFIKKNFGKLNGWIGYTWSKTRRNFPEILPYEYPAKYDRTHDVNMALSYDLNEKWSFGAVFVYATGNTYTMPYQRAYSMDGYFTDIYFDRNSLRMPAYHRADISATYIPKKSRASYTKTGKGPKVSSSWTFAFYNVYSRANPYFIYLDYEGDFAENTLAITPKQISLFPILPSVTWNFHF